MRAQRPVGCAPGGGRRIRGGRVASQLAPAVGMAQIAGQASSALGGGSRRGATLRGKPRGATLPVVVGGGSEDPTACVDQVGAGAALSCPRGSPAPVGFDGAGCPGAR
eukprot:193883-Pyramimonas_sp.AAC.1